MKSGEAEAAIVLDEKLLQILMSLNSRTGK